MPADETIPPTSKIEAEVLRIRALMQAGHTQGALDAAP
jgi:hypothetical protein